MRRVVTVLALASLAWASFSSAAVADGGYTDVGTDPDDVSRVEDVSWTRRTVFEGPNGRRWFRMKIRFYEPLDRVWGGAHASIDFKAGPRRDGSISFENIEGPPYCGVNLRSGAGWIFAARQFEHTISCTFRLRILAPTKRVRWWVRSPGIDPYRPHEFDKAPDSGWYI